MYKPELEYWQKPVSIVRLFDQLPAIAQPSGTTERPKPTPPMLSKVAKQIKQVREPVPRFFESPNQMQAYWSEGEYDLVQVFKMLEHEAFFLKTVQKKLSQLVKSGFEIHSDNDEIKEYFQNRFLMMFLQTNISLDKIVKQLGFYLIASSNAFVIKVRDKDCQFATSYKVDGKDRHPVVGLFIPHPTQMKPRFKWVTFSSNGQKKSKLVLDKWVHVNRRGVMVEFNPEDVAHFTLHKQDGMIFGTPEIIPVIDDIRTFRKMEEDSELLAYRDLFPIIHYSIEEPQIVDHASGMTEIDVARGQMERIIQDGGIVTDKRHEIKFVGSQGKHLDLAPYIQHFQLRVLSGLGVSQSDMGMGQDISGNTANSMSKALLDAVRFIQQELSSQFEELILTEMVLQSPFGVEALRPENRVKLSFTEIDIEWKIRKENHEADLFTKGVKTIDEVRNPMGNETFTDEHHGRTHHGLYEKPQLEAQNDIAEKQVKVAAATKTTQLRTKAAAAKKAHGVASAKKSTSRPKGSAATRDSVKSSKSNSNIVKSNRDMMLNDSIALQDEFKQIVTEYMEKNKTEKKVNLVVTTKCFYDRIKEDMSDRILEGMYDAATDLDIEKIDANKIKVEHNIFEPLDTLRDSVVTMIDKDPNSLNRAAVRVGYAHRTEQTRAYNYGYALMCVNNNRTDFTVYSDASDVATDSVEHIGKQLSLNKYNMVNDIPPYRTNSRLKIKVRLDNGKKESSTEGAGDGN